jgi:hypothetical protein
MTTKHLNKPDARAAQRHLQRARHRICQSAARKWRRVVDQNPQPVAQKKVALMKAIHMAYAWHVCVVLHWLVGEASCLLCPVIQDEMV